MPALGGLVNEAFEESEQALGTFGDSGHLLGTLGDSDEELCSNSGKKYPFSIYSEHVRNFVHLDLL
jgi:hypothetical protein